MATGRVIIKSPVSWWEECARIFLNTRPSPHCEYNDEVVLFGWWHCLSLSKRNTINTKFSEIPLLPKIFKKKTHYLNSN